MHPHAHIDGGEVARSATGVTSGKGLEAVVPRAIHLQPVNGHGIDAKPQLHVAAPEPAAFALEFDPDIGLGVLPGPGPCGDAQRVHAGIDVELRLARDIAAREQAGTEESAEDVVAGRDQKAGDGDREQQQ